MTHDLGTLGDDPRPSDDPDPFIPYRENKRDYQVDALNINTMKEAISWNKNISKLYIDTDLLSLVKQLTV